MSTQVHPADNPIAPDLRIIPTDQIVEHEYNDVQRTAPLAERIATEGILKNPPIVTPLNEGDPRYVVLDGANRSTALLGMGCPHILVQVVKYAPPQVTLTTWHHVVTMMQKDEFIDRLSEVEGIELIQTNLLNARAGLARREYLMYAVLADKTAYAARTEVPRRNIHETNRLLNALVDTYKNRCRLHRTMSDDVEEANRVYPNLTGIVIFPVYDPAEVLTLARQGELLPTGLTRHLIQGRALRLNYPLSELKSYDSLEEKNARLKAWLRRKMASREVRFYGETSYLFDE